MENQTVIEISETELDEVFGGVGRIGDCAQSADAICASSCCGNN